MTSMRPTDNCLPERISPLETELLTYIEKLVRALEHSLEQFNQLEKRSTEQIEQRLQVLEDSAKLLAASQASFLSDYHGLGIHPSATMPDDLTEILIALQDIAQAYEMKSATR